jgi:hypothetical protein
VRPERQHLHQQRESRRDGQNQAGQIFMKYMPHE